MSWSETAVPFIALILLCFATYGFVKLRKFLKVEARKAQESNAPERVVRVGMRSMQQIAAGKVHTHIRQLVLKNTQLRNLEPERFDGGRLEVLRSEETTGETTLTVLLLRHGEPSTTLVTVSLDYTAIGGELTAWYGANPKPYRYKLDERDKLIRLLENYLPAYGYTEAAPPPQRLALAAGATA